jgi:hypothetical protein
VLYLLPESAVLARWRSRVHPHTFDCYWSHLSKYLEFIGKGPDEAVAWADALPKKHEVLDSIENYLRSRVGLRYKSQQFMYTTIRSFYMHNRVELPHDPGFHIRAEVAPVERHLSLENVRELVGLAVQPFRSMILTKCMGILDTECLIYVSNHHAAVITEALQKNLELVKLTLPGRKAKRNIRPFYTFIGGDALESIRSYFDRERGWPKKDEPIWMYRNTQRPVSKIGFSFAWIALCRKAGLIPKEHTTDRRTRYGFNPHNTRDLTISTLNTVAGLNPKAIEFWAGHDIDPLGYNQFYSTSPQYVEDQYRLAMPYLNLLSGTTADPQETGKLRDKVAELETAVKALQAMSDYRITKPKVE